MEIHRLTPLRSPLVKQALKDYEVLNFVYAGDLAHMPLTGSLLVDDQGLFEILSSDEDVASFLYREMAPFPDESAVREFIQLFAEMRAYHWVQEKPLLPDARLTRGEELPQQEYRLELRRSRKSWSLECSLEVDPLSKGIYRYEIEIPMSAGGHIRLKRGERQYLAQFIL